MFENLYVAEYLMKSRERTLQKDARESWKWSKETSRNKLLRLGWFSIRRQSSMACCAPVPCC
ncbi:hypothetical protein D3C74_25700 [compost metagenome]